MAKVTINISDEKGAVEIAIIADPEADLDHESPDETQAQRLARLVLDFISDEMTDDYDVVVSELN